MSIVQRYGAQSEISQLKIVLVHRPGRELELIDFRNPQSWLFEDKPKLKLAQREHDEFVEILKCEGVRVINLEKGIMPNQYFVRDAGFVTSQGAIIGNLRYQVRKGEEQIVANKLIEIGIPILCRLKGEAYLEGGDIVFLSKEEVAIGIGERSNVEGAERIKRILLKYRIVKRVIIIPLGEGAFHLDLALNIANENIVGIYPKALPRGFIEELRKRYTILQIPYEDFKNLALNWLVLKPGKIVFIDGYEINRITRKLLEREGIDVVTLKIKELLKGRGGPRCMTMPILREDC